MASGKKISDADRRRANEKLKEMMGEGSKNISAMDKARVEEITEEYENYMKRRAPGMRDGGMAEQMAEQMYMSEREAGGLMKKAKRINDADMMNMADGGMARIKGTPPAQVKGFTYNDNGGKGTF